MSEIDDPDETIKVLEELIKQYSQVEERTDRFLSEQDASMKRMALQSIKKDIERLELDEE